MGTLIGSQLVTKVSDIVGKATSGLSVSGESIADRVLDNINWGQQRIARHYTFYEKHQLSTTAATVADIKRYPLQTGTNNLGLTNVQDIHTIRLDDSENSRKLTRWGQRKFDQVYPRPENYSTGRPSIYIRWGNEIEMFKIPDDAYDLKIRWAQWPTDITTTTASDYEKKDQLIIVAGALETYLALQEYVDAKIWFDKFVGMLSDAVKAEGDVDWEPQGDPFGGSYSNGQGGRNYISGEPWLDPYGYPGDPLYGYPG